MIRITKGQLKEMARREDPAAFARRIRNTHSQDEMLRKYLRTSPDPEGDIEAIIMQPFWSIYGSSWLTLRNSVVDLAFPTVEEMIRIGTTER